jgi:hypothetical protein
MVDSFNDLKRLFLINTTTHFKEQITHGSDFRY